MDPYLEGSYWTTFHTNFAVELAHALTQQLLPKYVAVATRRFILEEPDDVAIETAFYPDAAVVHAGEAPRGSSATATQRLTAPLELLTVMPVEVPQARIEIRDVAGRKLVTSIELLSPANKVGKERTKYLRKRNRLLSSDAHLLEIDLVHRGRRVPMQKPLPPAPYYVLLTRATRRPRSEVWPIQLQQPLPTISIPLLSGDDDILHDLQATFTATYDKSAFGVLIDYRQPPDVRLPPDEVAYVERMTRQGKSRGGQVE